VAILKYIKLHLGQGKSTYMFSVMFCFLLPARLQWLEPAGRKRKSADIDRKKYMLIYPDPKNWSNLSITVNLQLCTFNIQMTKHNIFDNFNRNCENAIFHVWEIRRRQRCTLQKIASVSNVQYRGLKLRDLYHSG
jgi:hypothetical protein